MNLSQNKPIENIEDLRNHLQFAIGLELATIPVYLTALYSIVEGQNTMATRVIQSVVIEEMLHMALAANVLNGIGGVPSPDLIDGQSPIIRQFPESVSFLPGLGKLDLRCFSREALNTFMAIEQPMDENATVPEGYSSIGAFYKAIEEAIDGKHSIDGIDAAFEEGKNTRSHCQIAATEYYGGAGELLQVECKQTALNAIQEIVEQGEGLEKEKLQHKVSEHCYALDHTASIPVTDGDVLADGWQMRSHYARFKEIQYGRRYKANQRIGDKPEGMVVPIDWDEVYPMVTNPCAEEYKNEHNEIYQAIHACNMTYTELLNDIYAAFNGQPKPPQEGELRNAVTIMWKLKDQAIALMKTPSPLHPGKTVGVPFKYLGKVSKK